jgi:hypothetical protein
LRPRRTAVNKGGLGSPIAPGGMLLFFCHRTLAFRANKKPGPRAPDVGTGRGKPGAHTASLATFLTWLQAGRPKGPRNAWGINSGASWRQGAAGYGNAPTVGEYIWINPKNHMGKLQLSPTEA